MSPLQLADALTSHFPGLRRELHAPAVLASLAAQLECFAAFTRMAAKVQDAALLKRCFAAAEHLLQTGDAPLAAALTTSYCYRLHLDALPDGGQLARQLMPHSLYSAYAEQQYARLHPQQGV